ncbi:MAG: 3,4-dioxygenase subunit beta [Acidimicrobiales bacterium]
MSTDSCHDTHEHDPDDLTERGLAFDLQTMSRRRLLAVLGGGAGALALTACTGTSTSASGTPGTDTTTTPPSATPTASAGSGDTTGGAADPTAAPTAGPTSAPAPTSTEATAAATVTEEIPDETAGPFPGNGSNGPDVLSEQDVVRSDITRSIGSASGVAEGVPLTFTMAIIDVASKTPLVGGAVYAWHCDALGRYSMYSDGVTEENYLRGVVEADANGNATFRSVFPGCYPGRWPHIHFEVYESVAAATGGADPLKTSQLAFPRAACEAVYTDTRYPGSADELAELSLASDGVFRDDQAVAQLAVTTGDATTGVAATLGVGV